MRGARCAGLRRSWLSREVLTLSLFAGAAGAFAGMLFFGLPGRERRRVRDGARGPRGRHLLGAHLYGPGAPRLVQRLHGRRILLHRAVAGPGVRSCCSIPACPPRCCIASVAGGAAQLIMQSGKFLWLSQSEVFELRSSSLLLAGRLRALFVTRLADSDRRRHRDSAGRGIAAGCIARGVRRRARRRIARALSLLRQRRAQEHRRGLHVRSKEGRMNWKRIIGLDNLAEEYSFARSESTGYTSARRFPTTGCRPPAAIARSAAAWRSA